MSTSLEQLRVFLDELDAQQVERLVVRWTDETRPVPTQEGHDEDTGYTVRRVARATLTAQPGGEVVQKTFEDVGYDELREVVAQYPFETLYRSDNLTR